MFEVGGFRGLSQPIRYGLVKCAEGKQCRRLHCRRLYNRRVSNSIMWEHCATLSIGMSVS